MIEEAKRCKSGEMKRERNYDSWTMVSSPLSVGISIPIRQPELGEATSENRPYPTFASRCKIPNPCAAPPKTIILIIIGRLHGYYFEILRIRTNHLSLPTSHSSWITQSIYSSHKTNLAESNQKNEFSQRGGPSATLPSPLFNKRQA
jgi:hypothetical protein